MTVNWSWISPDPYPLLIDGQLVVPASRRTFEVFYPFNNERVASVYEAGAAEVERAVAAARRAVAGDWGHSTPKERAEYLTRFAQLLRAEAEKYAFLETVDVGAPISANLHYSLPQAVDAFAFYAGQARTLLGEVVPTSERQTFNYRVYEPVGVVAELLPWNGPLLMGCLKVAAILAAGNAVIIKPPSAASMTTAALADLYQRAGFPPGVVNILCGPGEQVGAALVGHPGVDLVSLTGGTATGRQVMALAAGTLKQVALELGGKSPNIVFEDADLERAVPWAALAAFMNQGEICVCGSRLLLQRSIYAEFVDQLVEHARQLRLGDPLDPSTEIGPLISRHHQEKVLGYIQQGIREGARLVTGGHAPERPELRRGNFVLPTIFADVDNRMCIAQEEIFGPVLSVIPFETEAEAVALGNDVIYGLAAGLWTRDVSRALRLARQLNVGQVYVNRYYSPTMHESPAAGHKQSGVGGAGLFKYLQPKSVYVQV